MNKKNDDFKENFVQFMKKHNLTAYSWAKKAGISEGTIRAYLSGRSNSINTNTLVKLASALNVSINDIFYNNFEVDENKYLSNLDIDKELFIKSVSMVDDIIDKQNLNIPSSVKAKLYLAWYELKILSKEDSNQDIIDESKFNALINIIR